MGLSGRSEHLPGHGPSFSISPVSGLWSTNVEHLTEGQSLCQSTVHLTNKVVLTQSWNQIVFVRASSRPCESICQPMLNGP